MDKKFNIKRHPNVHDTTDGIGETFRHGAVTESVAALVFDETVDPAILPESETPDIEYELLSDEDLETLFFIRAYSKSFYHDSDKCKNGHLQGIMELFLTIFPEPPSLV